MPSFESILERIFSDRRFLTTLLIGGLLCFVPILNIFAFGYLYAYAKQVSQRGDFSLPQWKAWDRMFIDGLRFLILWLLFLVLPLALVASVGALLTLILHGLGSPVAYMMLSVAYLFVPVWFVVMLHRYQRRERLVDLKIQTPGLDEVFALLKKLWLPLLAMAGVMVLGAPLYGFALFAVHVFFLPYALLLVVGRARGFV